MPPKGTVLNKDDPNLLAFLAYIIDKKVSINWKEVASLYNTVSGEEITGNAIELRFRDMRKKARAMLPPSSDADIKSPTTPKTPRKRTKKAAAITDSDINAEPPAKKQKDDAVEIPSSAEV